MVNQANNTELGMMNFERLMLDRLENSKIILFGFNSQLFFANFK